MTVDLKTYLCMRGIKQRKLSKRLKVTHGYVSRCVNGKQEWSPKAAKIVASMLGLRMVEVLGNEINIDR